MSAYSEASKAVFAVFEDTTPLVEGLSIDEAFLDVRGLERLSGSPIEIAVRLRRNVLERVGLPITVGVARTKFLAKVASAVAKPDGLLVVPPESELDFLHPLPVGRLWGVGPVTAGKLESRGITTVGQVALLDESVADVDARTGVGPASPRPRPQPRSSAGARRPAPSLDRLSARSRPLVEIARCRGGNADRARRPRHAAASHGPASRPHRRPPASLRRLLPRDALADAAPGDRRDRRRSS